MNERPPAVPPLKRRDVYPGPLVDGLPARDGPAARLARQFQRALTSRAEREEAVLEHRIRSQPVPTRPNVIALASAKGGVGKSTVTFVVGNLLATHLNLRVVAVDANPDFGTLGRMPPDDRRCDRSLVDLLDDADGLRTAAELNVYVSRLASGLHVLGAPSEPAARLAPDHYGELVAFLSCFYEVVLLDLETGLDAPVARVALDRADQLVLVTTSDLMAATLVLKVLPNLDDDRMTLVVNASPALAEEHFPVRRSVVIPHDAQLASMLDSGSYALDALQRPTRGAVKRLGLAVAEQLV